MGTLNAIYVRITEPYKVAKLLETYPKAFTEPGSSFHAIMSSSQKPPVDDLSRLSEDLDTDILWLSFQSVVDAFEFYHWRSGKRMRALVFGCYAEERTWERAEGDPEPWELAAIFDLKRLAYALEDAPADEVEELRRIWKDSVIMAGHHDPSIDARETARKVAEYYHLPGWHLALEA
jgi:hypothetical protein